MSATAPPAAEEWRADKNGKQFVQGPGRGFAGRIFRQGEEETVEDARARAADAQANAGAREARPRERKAPRGKGRRPDRPPHVEPQPKSVKAKPSREQLAAAAEVPLKGIGTFVGYQMLGCEFCAKSMQSNAGLAATDLAASDNPYMVALLQWWHGVMMMVMAGGSGIPSYLLPPVVHHTPMPDFARVTLSGMMGIPPRQPQHDHSHPAPAPAETPPPQQQQAPPQAPPPGPGAPPPPPPQSRPPVPQMTPQDAARIAQERAGLEAEARRLMSVRDLAMRQQAAASQPRGPNVPPYVATNGLIPEAPANIRESAPGTPAAPATEPGADAGSPLPPEAGGGY